MTRVISAVILGVALFAGAVYYLDLFHGNSVAPPTSDSQTADAKLLAALGGDLYRPEPEGIIEPLREVRNREPIVVIGQLNVYDKAEVSSQIEGIVQYVGEEIPVGAQLVGGVAPFLPDPCYITRYKSMINVPTRSLNTSIETKWSNQENIIVYRRLMKGDIVEKSQMLASLNPVKAEAEKRSKMAKVESVVADQKSTAMKAITYEQSYYRDKAIEDRNIGAIGAQTLAFSYATWQSAKYDAEAKQQAITEARSNLDQAQLFLSQHSILNQIPTRTAIIKEVFRERGEAVKPGDKIMELQSQDRFVAEGLVEMQYESRVRPGMRVTIEPTQEEAPLGRARKFHRREVNSVAFTNHPVPLIISASEDHSVLLWDREFSDPVPPNIQFPDPVRVVAGSPQGSAHNLILAGCSDGSIYMWDLEDLDQKAPRKITPEKQSMGEAVTSLAISLDGNFFASGSDNASIKMWSLDAIRKNHAVRLIAGAIKDDKTWAPPTGNPKKTFDRALALLGNKELIDTMAAGDLKKARAELDALYKELDGKELLYPFDAEHGAANFHFGAITSLHFTPQCRLVSASRDNSVRVWALKQKGVLPVGFPIKDRKGDVAQLGVSRDGRFMLFDQGKTLQILAVEDGRTINTLQAPGNNIDFQVSAIFSPDGSLMLTAGAAEGRLQLWSTPGSGGRGFEVRQFVSDERSPVTCAAFAPLQDPQNKNKGSLAVSGTKDGYVYVWPIPSANEVRDHPIRDVTLTSVYPYVDRSTHHLQLAVDVRNQTSPQYPQGRLIPGRFVTIVIRN